MERKNGIAQLSLIVFMKYPEMRPSLLQSLRLVVSEIENSQVRQTLQSSSRYYTSVLTLFHHALIYKSETSLTPEIV
jgi:hypothetical protein